ncbi:hypothetical protein [Bacteroides sp. 51]|uniref:hypothetical protein n=1 Tax=Bacteroides sp. 51 TaxID=2302938 RepID=UPI0013D24331|nr:hypothetical protein [Bacteroides sp. 51]NDV81837.1 hypothetical protein [Bacteroides sp. 51]
MKKKNLKVTIVCKELGIELSEELYSPEIQKLIKAKKTINRRATVKDCNSDIIETIYELWEAEDLAIPGEDGIESLAKFIYNTFRFAKKNGDKGYLALSSIASMLYKLKRKG